MNAYVTVSLVLAAVAASACGGKTAGARQESTRAPTGHRDTPEENEILVAGFIGQGCKIMVPLQSGYVRLQARCGGSRYLFTGEDDGGLSVVCSGSAESAAQCATLVEQHYTIGKQCKETGSFGTTKCAGE